MTKFFSKVVLIKTKLLNFCAKNFEHFYECSDIKITTTKIRTILYCLPRKKKLMEHDYNIFVTQKDYFKTQLALLKWFVKKAISMHVLRCDVNRTSNLTQPVVPKLGWHIEIINSRRSTESIGLLTVLKRR